MYYVIQKILYLAANDIARLILRQRFHEVAYRRAERKYKKDNILGIENVSTSDPNGIAPELYLKNMDK